MKHARKQSRRFVDAPPGVLLLANVKKEGYEYRSLDASPNSNLLLLGIMS